MAASLGVRDAAPTFLMLERPAPQGFGPTPAPIAADIPNNHLQYALTWFGLAVDPAGRLPRQPLGERTEVLDELRLHRGESPPIGFLDAVCWRAWRPTAASMCPRSGRCSRRPRSPDSPACPTPRSPPTSSAGSPATACPPEVLTGDHHRGLRQLRPRRRHAPAPA